MPFAFFLDLICTNDFLPIPYHEQYYGIVYFLGALAMPVELVVAVYFVLLLCQGAIFLYYSGRIKQVQGKLDEVSWNT